MTHVKFPDTRPDTHPFTCAMDGCDGEEETVELVEAAREEEGRRPVEQLPINPGLTRAQAIRLYVSHAFSAWNARGYEFAAVSHTTTAAKAKVFAMRDNGPC